MTRSRNAGIISVLNHLILQVALEDFIHEYNYVAVHMKFRGGKGMAYVYFSSFEEAEDMVHELNSEMFYGRSVDVKHCDDGIV